MQGIKSNVPFTPMVLSTKMTVNIQSGTFFPEILLLKKACLQISSSIAGEELWASIWNADPCWQGSLYPKCGTHRRECAERSSDSIKSNPPLNMFTIFTPLSVAKGPGEGNCNFHNNGTKVGQ